MNDPWQVMDDWCRAQCQRLLAQTNPHILKGRDLNDRQFRRLLGQSQAFFKMRSFIHGHRNASAGEAGTAETTKIGSAEGEHATRSETKGDAQNTSSGTN